MKTLRETTKEAGESGQKVSTYQVPVQDPVGVEVVDGDRKHRRAYARAWPWPLQHRRQNTKIIKKIRNRKRKNLDA